MKKLILAAVAASVVATPAAAAPFSGHADRGRIEQVQRGHPVQRTRQVQTRSTVRTRIVTRQARQWQRGQRFDSRYAHNYRVISNPRAYRLYNAPRGYRWVQSGNDAVLVAIVSGLIGAVIGNAL